MGKKPSRANLFSHTPSFFISPPKCTRKVCNYCIERDEDLVWECIARFVVLSFWFLILVSNVNVVKIELDHFVCKKI